jgi:hypothetical protein
LKSTPRGPRHNEKFISFPTHSDVILNENNLYLFNRILEIRALIFGCNEVNCNAGEEKSNALYIRGAGHRATYLTNVLGFCTYTNYVKLTIVLNLFLVNASTKFFTSCRTLM